MKFLTCSIDSLPCPLESQTLVSLADLVSEAIALIEPSEIAAAYAFGATSVITWWGIGFAISAGIKAIGKA